MGVKLVHINSNPLPKSSKPLPKLTLIQGDKDTPQLWPGDVSPIPLPKIMPAMCICHRCGESDEFAWVNEHSIYCYSCNLTSIQTK